MPTALAPGIRRMRDYGMFGMILVGLVLIVAGAIIALLGLYAGSRPGHVNWVPWFGALLGVGGFSIWLAAFRQPARPVSARVRRKRMVLPPNDEPEAPDPRGTWEGEAPP